MMISKVKGVCCFGLESGKKWGVRFVDTGVCVASEPPIRNKLLSGGTIAVGILLQFVLSLASFIGGYQLFTTGRLNI